MSTALGRHASADRETKWPLGVHMGRTVAGGCGYDATFTCHTRTGRSLPYKAARAPIRRAFAVKTIGRVPKTLYQISKVSDRTIGHDLEVYGLPNQYHTSFDWRQEHNGLQPVGYWRIYVTARQPRSMIRSEREGYPALFIMDTNLT